MSQFRMYVPAKPMYVEDYTTKLTAYNICSHSLSPACIPLVVYTCSCTCHGKNELPKLAFPGTFLRQNMDSLQKIWTSGISWGVFKVSQARQFSNTQSTLASFQHSNFVTNSHFECCMRPLRCTDNDRCSELWTSLMYVR